MTVLSGARVVTGDRVLDPGLDDVSAIQPWHRADLVVLNADLTMRQVLHHGTWAT